MLVLTTNPTTVLGGTTITGTAGVHNGDAVYGNGQPWTLINYGGLEGAGTGSFGVYLTAGGEVVNTVNGPVVGSIVGGEVGVAISGGAGTLVNQGTIKPTGTTSLGVLFNNGTVTNGASG